MGLYDPTDFRAIPITTTSVKLTWQNKAIYSVIEITCVELEETVKLYKNQSQYIWPALTPGETYTFRLEACYYETGIWSDPLFAMITMGETGSPPQNLEIRKWHTYAELSWFSLELNLDAIEIFRSDGDHVYGETALDSVPPNVEFFRDTSPLAHCWYKVRYRVGESYSDWSNEVEYIAPEAPADVTNFVAEEIWADHVVLSWAEPTTGDLPSGYTLYLKVGDLWLSQGSLPYGWNHVLFEGLSPETSYQFRIKSVGPGGGSAGVELTVQTISLAESLELEKSTSESRQFRLTIGEPAKVVVFSGETGTDDAYPFQLIETEELTLRLGGELFSDNIQSGGGQVVISAIIGEDETALEETFLDFNLIGERLFLDVIIGDNVHRVGGGLISSVELKDHKITISYDDAMTAKVGTITPEKIGDEIVPEIWGWADVNLIEVDALKKKYKAASHRIKGIDMLWQNEALISSSNYFVNYSTGEVTFGPGVTIEEKDIFTARVNGHVDARDYVRQNPADILSYYLGEFFDKKLSSPTFRSDGGLTLYPIYMCVDDDIPVSEMVGRICRQLGLLAWQGPDGLVIRKANSTRPTDIYIQPDLEIIKSAERIVSQENLCSRIIVHYGQQVSIPDENRIEKTYRAIGKEKEYEIWGSLNDAYDLVETIFPAWDGKERWSFSLPYILWNLWPGKVVEFETGEKIVIENIEFQFSKNQTNISGVKL